LKKEYLGHYEKSTATAAVMALTTSEIKQQGNMMNQGEKDV